MNIATTNSTEWKSEFEPELEPEIQDEGLDQDNQDAGMLNPDLVMTHPFDPTKIQIQTKQDTLLNLINRLNNDEIDMNTDFQRHAELWSTVQMSRLIESILIRFPLPAFYFDASNDDKWLVVDGLQRLSTIRKFVVEKKLRLSGLEYLNNDAKNGGILGLSYDELPRSLKRRIDECPVTLFLIQPGTPDDVKYGVFRRINTGGLVLNNQEIRNALAKDRERDLLCRLAKDENMVRTMGDQSKRMVDQELVLRFIAFYTMDYLKSPKNIAAFLDEMMERLKRETEAEFKRLEEAFRRALAYCEQLFGSLAFEKRNGEDNKRKRKNSALFEVWTVSLAKVSDANAMLLVERKDMLNEKMQALVNTDNEFFQAISMATQKRDNVRIRYDRIQKIIQEVLNA